MALRQPTGRRRPAQSQSVQTGAAARAGRGAGRQRPHRRPPRSPASTGVRERASCRGRCWAASPVNPASVRRRPRPTAVAEPAAAPTPACVDGATRGRRHPMVRRRRRPRRRAPDYRTLRRHGDDERRRRSRRDYTQAHPRRTTNQPKPPPVPFDLSTQNVPALAKICERVGGKPVDEAKLARELERHAPPCGRATTPRTSIKSRRGRGPARPSPRLG